MTKKFNTDEKVLITGGSGFIGRHLVEVLLEQGYRVRILDVSEKPKIFPFTVEYNRGSVLDRERLRNSLADVSVVYHLAAIPDLWAKKTEVFHQVNAEGSRIVIEEAVSANVRRIIHVSTEAILKGCKDNHGQIIHENSPLPEIDQMPGPYSRSKWLADQTARNFAEKGAPVIIAYPTIPVGPGDVNLTPPTRMILNFLNGKTPAFLDCWLNLVPVREVAWGLCLAAVKGQPGDRLIFSNENLRLSRLLEILQQETGIEMPRRRVPYSVSLSVAFAAELISSYVTGRKPVASVEGVRLAGADLRFDNQKTRHQLGLEKFPLRKAIVETTNWLRDFELTESI